MNQPGVNGVLNYSETLWIRITNMIQGFSDVPWFSGTVTRLVLNVIHGKDRHIECQEIVCVTNQ